MDTTADAQPACRPVLYGNRMDPEHRLKRLRYRAWHRGTKEADLMVGGFFDQAHPRWSAAEIDWFEALLEEQDVDIMAWAMGRQDWPTHLRCAEQEAMMRLDYIPVAR